MEEFVARFGANASKAAQAQSRAKALEKLKANAIEMPAPAAGAGPGDARHVSASQLPALQPAAPLARMQVLSLATKMHKSCLKIM